VPSSGRLVVDESPIRLEVRCRNGGDLLSDGDLDELVALARSEGSNRKPASYHTRRREAFEHVDTMRRTLIATGCRKELRELEHTVREPGLLLVPEAAQPSPVVPQLPLPPTDRTQEVAGSSPASSIAQ
jgi:hypothetical protein